MTLDLFKRPIREIFPGCLHVPDFIDLEWQQSVMDQLRAGARLMVQPETPSGSKLSVKLWCYGDWWEPYRYSAPRLPMPSFLIDLWVKALFHMPDKSQWYSVCDWPDTAIVNWYSPDASLGLHQDNSEAPELLAAGRPIVTISLGCTAIFKIGSHVGKMGPYQDIEVRSGDMVLMWGPSRLRYHSIVRVDPGTSPLRQKGDGRLSITMREVRG